MKTIALINSPKLVYIDDEDYLLVCQYKWRLRKSGHRNPIYYVVSQVQLNNKRNIIKLHRLIMGDPEGLLIDHIDGDPLNNQKSNLRICTHQQNMCNRKPYGQSKYLGVSLSVTKRECCLKSGAIKVYEYTYWQSQISHNGKIIKIGNFKTELEAAMAYDAMAIKLHGEFANLNIKH